MTYSTYTKPLNRKAYNKKYYKKNKTKIKKANQKYYKTYYQKNKDKIKKATKKYKDLHKDKYKKYLKIYYRKNKKVILTKLRETHLKREYGMSLKDYNKLFIKQKEVCAICKVKKLPRYQKNLHVDHCHKTKKIRGLLCWKCNSAIGLFNDNISILLAAIKYLKFRET